jgi:PilZ domain
MSAHTRDSRRAGARLHGEKRRGRRMNSRVPVRLEWSDDNKPVSIDAHTRVISPYGCMIILDRPLPLEQRFTLTNLATEASNAAIIVWKSTERPDGWEYGIELIAPEMDYWGIDL